MKKYCFICFALIGTFLLVGCAGAGQDVSDTPVGSVLTGETHTPDGYLDRVSQQNRANTQEAGVNQTTYQSHEHTNFGTSRERY
jgi:predicted small secreted protein